MRKRCTISTVAAAGLSVAFVLGLAFGAGAQQYVLDFSGDSDSMVESGLTPSDLGLDGNASRTMEAWALTRGFNDGGVFSMGTRSAGMDFSHRTLGSTNDWRVQFWGGDFDFDFNIPTQNEWVHFALVHDGDEEESFLYADGEVVGSGDQPLNTGNDNTFRVGSWHTSDFFDGLIGEVRVWDHARTQEQINDNMNQRLTGNEDGLIVYWPLHEGQDGTAHDFSGSDYPGSIEGNVEWVERADFPVEAEEAPPLVETAPPSLVTVGEGGTASLGPVQVHEYYEDEAEFEWYFEDELLGEGANTWDITDVSSDDEGVYTVVVSHPPLDPTQFVLDEREVEPEEFEIEVVVSIVTRLPQDQQARIGEDATFTVSAIEGSTFEWFFNGELVSEQQFHVIPEVGMDDYGTYTVWVRHDEFPDEEWQVELSAPDMVETPPAPVVGVSEGGDVTLGPVLVFSEYEADATYSWIFEGTEVSTEPEYTLTDAAREDAGIYTVTVSHPSFPEDSQFEVDVKMPPFAPAAGGLGLAVLGGAFALLGGAYGIRRMRK